MSVSILPASAEHRPALDHFFLAFFYDLSAYDPNIAINPYGLPTWAPAGLPGPRDLREWVATNTWVRDRCDQYLLVTAEGPIGFATVCALSEVLPEGVDQELLDFYVAPKYRNQGLGAAAARQIFARYPGRWQVCELPGNVAAQRFWQRIIAAHAAASYELRDNGTTQRFTQS